MDVNRTISPNDRMKGSNPNDEAYFRAGQSVAHTLQGVMTLAGLKPKSILDYGCGYGRVLRWFQAYWPEADLSAADIEPEQIAFCAENFKATPVLLDKPFPEIKLPGKYDAIWLGSIFTHLDEPSWVELLHLLRAHMNPKGVLCFSFAGRAVYQQIKAGERGGLPKDEPAVRQFLYDYERAGFGFLRQLESNKRPWGRSIAHASRALSLIYEMRGKIVLFSEQAYAGRQDIMAVRFE